MKRATHQVARFLWALAHHALPPDQALNRAVTSFNSPDKPRKL